MPRSRPLIDQALKVAAGCLLTLLAYDGRSILHRLDALELNQTRILVHLGIPPIASTSLENRDGNALFAAEK